MASIPLTALAVRPVEQPDVLGNYSRLMQLRALQQDMNQNAQEAPYRQQILQQRAQAGQIELQNAQQGQRDQQALTAAYQQWDGKSYDALPQLVQKNGGSAGAVNAATDMVIKRKKEISDMASQDAATGQTNLKNQLTRNGLLSQSLRSLESVPDDQLSQTILSTSQQLAQQGILDPQHLQMAQHVATLPPMQAKAALENMRKGLLSDEQAMREAQQAENVRHNKAMEAATATQRDETARHNRAMEARPVAGQGMSGAGPTDDAAQSIYEGKAPPVLTEYSYRDRTNIVSALRKIDPNFNLSQAEQDWKATQKYLSTLNGAQQTRLRQALQFSTDTIPQLRDAFNEWKQEGTATGFKAFNSAGLKLAENTPGKAGSAAHQLDSLIADFASELGTVYKGGNSSTDESLKLAARNLQSNWNEQTFNDALSRIERSLRIRSNSMNLGATGVSSGTPYKVPNTGSGGNIIVVSPEDMK